MDLNTVDKCFLSVLMDRLPSHVFRDIQPRYLEEPRRRYNGKAGAVIAPEDTQQVSIVLKMANEARVGVVPFGGGTGLVGGQIKADDPIPLLVSLERMNTIRDVLPEENVLICQAGTILSEIQSTAESVDRLFPLSFAAEGSAQIGGNLATNAGGVTVLRYGNARDLCLSMEVVLPDGEIWDGLKRLRKDNTGYDLRNLMIGSEGTLGIITAASLKLSPRPAQVGTAFVIVPTPAAAIALLDMAQTQLCDGISAFELLNGQGLKFLRDTVPDVRQPFSVYPDWLVLVEVGLPGGLNATRELETLFANALDSGLVSDGLVAQSQSQKADFWAVREHLPEANNRIGAVCNLDISVPISNLPAFIEQAEIALARFGAYRVNCFGHLGDGNLHYNIFAPPGDNAVEHRHQYQNISLKMLELVDGFDGSISAEHGIGRLKVDELVQFGDPVKLAAMRAIKSALDPKGIMNPGAVFAA